MEGNASFVLRRDENLKNNERMGIDLIKWIIMLIAILVIIRILI